MKEKAKEVPKKKKVAIVGFALTKDQAPYDDPEFEVWTVNQLYRFVPRQDRIFQLHKREGIITANSHGGDGEKHIEELKAMDIPIYMQERHDDIPTSVKYPFEEMVQEFGIPRKGFAEKDAYFTNSISFMIALAIHEGFEEIHVYGVDMAVNEEYHFQRPSCEYYLGIAMGRGIKVYLPPESDLLRTRFTYAYEEEMEHAWKLKMDATLKHMKNQKTQVDTAIRNQQSVSDKYEGAIQAILEMDKVWG